MHVSANVAVDIEKLLFVSMNGDRSTFGIGAIDGHQMVIECSEEAAEELLEALRKRKAPVLC